MIKLIVVILLTAVFNVSCSKPKSKNAAKTTFVRGNPLQLLAGSQANGHISITESDIEPMNSMELVNLRFFAEVGEKPTGAAYSHLEKGNEPTSFDVTEIPVDPYTINRSGDQLKYEAEANNVSLIFQPTHTDQLHFKALRLHLRSGEVLDLPIQPIHSSWSKDKQAVSFLFTIKARISEKGKLTHYQHMQETTLVNLIFATHSPEQTPAGKTDENNNYLLGPGVRTRWPINSTVNLEFCTPEPNPRFPLQGVEKWNEALEGKLNIKTSVSHDYPPFSDLTRRCVYLVDDFLIVDDGKSAVPAQTYVATNIRSQHIFDADIFFYQSEFDKRPFDFYAPETDFIANKVFTHELGHFLGLHHKFDKSTESIMSYSPYTRNLLYSYDINAIVANYTTEEEVHYSENTPPVATPTAVGAAAYQTTSAP